LKDTFQIFFTRAKIEKWRFEKKHKSGKGKILLWVLYEALGHGPIPRYAMAEQPKRVVDKI
jgi:hypothetical protein